MKQIENQMTGAAERDYRMDNLKCLLIFAVVFGHMLELFMGKNDSFKVIYLVIYSFHMPLFAFVSGVFARFSPEKIRNHLIYPYMVFQILYLLFANLVLEKEAEVQFTTPYWLLWYLFASIAWNLLLPLVQGNGWTWKKKAVALSAAFLAGILIGFDNKAGYYLSFSRIVEFFPYFLMGVYYREWEAQRKGERPRRRAGRPAILVFLGILLCALIYVVTENVDEIRYAWLYGSVSYDTGDYSWRFRLLSIGAALLWLVFFLAGIPIKRLPVLSHIGANTMSIYLLHGFLIKLMSKTRLFNEIEHDLFTGLLISACLVLILSWRPLVRLLSPLLRWEGSRSFLRRSPDGGGKRGLPCAGSARRMLETLVRHAAGRGSGRWGGGLRRRMDLKR